MHKAVKNLNNIVVKKVKIAAAVKLQWCDVSAHSDCVSKSTNFQIDEKFFFNLNKYRFDC